MIEIEKAISKAQILCSKSEKSAYDIRMLLIKWKLPKSKHEIVITKLYEDNFLNDLRYANSFVHDKIKINIWGRKKISYILRQKGFPQETIINALESINEKDYLFGLEKILKNKMKSLKNKSSYELKAKLFQFASSRGFSSNDIEKIATKILSSSATSR